MSKFTRTIRSNRFKTILTFVLLAILSISVIGIGVKLNSMVTTKEIPSYSFQRGYVDENGACKTDDLTRSVYSDIINVDGLECSVKNDDIKYQLFYYDETNAFISASAELTDDYTASTDSSLPDNAKYVRIVISPINGDVVTIGNYLVYASHLSITVSK